MQLQYASTQTNQTAVLHSSLKLNLPLEVFFFIFFYDPGLYFSLLTLENEYQQSACTCCLWLIRLCAPPVTARASLFCNCSKQFAWWKQWK